MDKLKELKDEELNNVVGGSTTENAPKDFSAGSFVFTGFVSKYAESHIGQMFYAVSHDGDEYYCGILRDSFEAESTFWTERTHVLSCLEHNGKSFTGIVELSGDDYWLYRERIK